MSAMPYVMVECFGHFKPMVTSVLVDQTDCDNVCDICSNENLMVLLDGKPDETQHHSMVTPLGCPDGR